MKTIKQYNSFYFDSSNSFERSLSGWNDHAQTICIRLFWFFLCHFFCTWYFLFSHSVYAYWWCNFCAFIRFIYTLIRCLCHHPYTLLYTYVKLRRKLNTIHTPNYSNYLYKNFVPVNVWTWLSFMLCTSNKHTHVCVFTSYTVLTVNLYSFRIRARSCYVFN